MASPRFGIDQVLRGAGLLDAAPGVAVACSSPRTGIVTWAAGQLPDGSAVSAATPMYAASVTKQVIAALAAQQVLAGRLNPDQRVIEVLPALPWWAAPIRMRHLVHHTSGLPASKRVLAAVELVDERQLDNDLVLQGLRRLSGPDAPAGVGYVYSNIGYVVLAELLAALTSTPVPVLAQRFLFTPLGMAHSGLLVAERLSLREDVRPPRTLGDGGLWTSADDLLVWLDALNHDRLGAELTRLVQSPGHLDDGTPLDYAWGSTARNSPAGVSYTHGGNWPGWSAKTVRRPSTGTAVALLSTSNAVELVSRAAVELHDRLARGDWA